ALPGETRMLKCFVSFCVEDVRTVDVKMLVEQLKSRTNSSIDFAIYYETDLGDSLTDFMRQQLRECHVCLILLSPKYKHRIDNTIEKSGAYQEYDIIVSRLENRTTYAKPRVVPILWAGNSVEDAFPAYIRNMNPHTCTLTKFRAHGTTQGGQP